MFTQSPYDRRTRITMIVMSLLFLPVMFAVRGICWAVGWKTVPTLEIWILDAYLLILLVYLMYRAVKSVRR